MTDAPGPYREESLRQALATDPRVMESELEVSIAGSRVVISGTVPTEGRREAVTDVARERFPIWRSTTGPSCRRCPPPPERSG